MADKKETLLSKLTSDYAEKIANTPRSYLVEALDTTIYWKQENMAQRKRYFAGLVERDLDAFIDVIIHRALDELGRRLFKPADKQVFLTQVDPEIIMEMANAILGADDEDVEEGFKEAEKN